MIEPLGKLGRPTAGQDRVLGSVRHAVQVRLPEHVALAHDARRDPHRVDGPVELGVRRRHEHLFQTAAAVRPRS